MRTAGQSDTTYLVTAFADLIHPAADFDQQVAVLRLARRGLIYLEANGAAQIASALTRRRKSPGRKNDEGCAFRLSYNCFSIAGRRLCSVVFGAKRATALPARSIRNFVKFHLMVLVPNSPRFSFFRYW